MSAEILKVEKLITENIFTRNIYMDLSDLSLTEIPLEVYEANHLEGFYLSNNNLEFVPIIFFEKFPRLKLLDLRFNQIKELPQEIKNLKSLEILLLDGNQITSLPEGLGSLKNIKSLNIGSNPLIYPPEDVIKLGYKSIIASLNGENNCESLSLSNDLITNKNNEYSNETDKTIEPKLTDKLFKPKIYKEIHQSFLDKSRKMKGSKTKDIVTQSDKHNSLVNLFPEPVSLENIERKMVEQMRLEKMKEVKQKREAELQRTKSKTASKEWQDETKDLQSFKRRQQANKLPLEIKFESDDRVLKAPFKVQKEFLETISGEDLDLLKQTTIKDDPKPQPMDREMQIMLDAERRDRQRTIQADIRKHNEYLNNKRNLPKGSAKEELEAAKRDMEIFAMLRRSLMSSGSEFRPF